MRGPALLMLALFGAAARAEGADAEAAQPASAHAQPLALLVERDAGTEDCPDTLALVQAIERINGDADGLRPAQAGDAAIEVFIARDEQGYVARIEAPGGIRELRDGGPSCAGMADALALTLAILVDDQPPRPAPQPKRPAKQRPPPETPRPERPAPSWAAGVEAGAGVSMGIAGGAWPALTAAAEMRLQPMWSFAAGALWSPVHGIDHGPGEVVVTLVAAMLRACMTWPGFIDRPPTPWLCLMGAAGSLSGEGVGYAENFSESRPWFAGGASAGFDGPLIAPLRWHLRIAWLVQHRQQFGVDRNVDGAIGPYELAYDPPLVGALLGAGVAAVWP
jgi:hypothetical protein